MSAAAPVAGSPAGAPDGAFVVKDCSLVPIATGRRAQTLRELRDHLYTVDLDSIYHHFWGIRLGPNFDELEYPNDFAAWARWGLHDPVLAERLAVIDPASFRDLEALRQELIEVIEERLDEREWVPWARADQQFVFIRSQMVVFDTGRRIMTPRDLVDAVRQFSLGSIFYHVIDARLRHPDAADDLRAWLSGWGERYREVIGDLAAIDPYFLSLAELREELLAVLNRHLGGEGS